MTDPASLPPADERQPPLGEEELAKLELGVSIGVLLRPDDSRRLIAALRASRAEVERLREALEEVGGLEPCRAAGGLCLYLGSTNECWTACRAAIAGDGLGVAQEEEG